MVQHILKSNFQNYEKGETFRSRLTNFLGHGIFNIDGESWKFQRQVASHEFSTKSLRKFVETVVDTELSDRLIPILSSAAKNGTALDFQNILQRFAFDNICKIAFGSDPVYLSPSLPQAKFALAFEDSVRISYGSEAHCFNPTHLENQEVFQYWVRKESQNGCLRSKRVRHEHSKTKEAKARAAGREREPR